MLAFAPSFFANFKLTIVMLMCVAALLASVLFLAAATGGDTYELAGVIESYSG
jgi:hypothetical protein